ncbi:MAG: ribosome biogenesis GTPase YlqF [Polyangiaceae bacterium]|nr:ribosome biogenesis GTPase YlqF [Polyangiaceae bacterium]
MSIGWYPGHMARARRELAEARATCDLVIEVLDARAPRATSNPVLDELFAGVARIVVLAKADLADARATDEWVEALTASRGSGARIIALSLSVPSSRAPLERLASSLASRGARPRALVVGVPNVGKSTLVNLLAGRVAAKVGDRPAVTRAAGTVATPSGLVLADHPGILSPKLDDQAGARRLALLGCISDAALDLRVVAEDALQWLAREHPDRLAARYGADARCDEPARALDAIGRRRGCLRSGGVVDAHKAALVLLGDVRSGALGRLTLERAGDPTAAG